MIHKNPGITQNGTQKSGSTPEMVPKIMAHLHPSQCMQGTL